MMSRLRFLKPSGQSLSHLRVMKPLHRISEKHCNVNSKRFLYGFYPSKRLSQAPVFFLLPPFQHEWYSRKAKAKDAVGQYYLDAEFDYITEAAIKAFIAQNGPINLPSEQLFLVFCRGVSPTKKTPIDSNNVYTGAITNAICRVLQHGDGWDMMSFLYTAIPTESDPYLEVILCSKADLFHWL